jgi:hypothetical protein
MVEQAIAHEQAALKLSPGHPEYLDRLRLDLSLLAQVLFAMGENTKAIDAIAEITRCVTDDGFSYYGAASLAALWVERIAMVPTIPEEQRKELARAYAEKAMEMLRQAVQKGFTDVRLLTRSDFNSLRDRDEFKQLVKELEAKSQKGAL